MNENDVLFQKVTQAYSEKKIRVLLSGTSNRKVLGSTPDRSTRIFSEYTCVTFWNNTSFSFIHQAGNIPSHLFHIYILFTFQLIFCLRTVYEPKSVFTICTNRTDRQTVHPWPLVYILFTLQLIFCNVLFCKKRII